MIKVKIGEPVTLELDPMIRNKTKPYSGRHREEGPPRHWLHEGSTGQESLLLELDPCLYALDQALATVAASVAHSVDHGEEKPYAVLVPPAQTVGWQLGFLSKNYNVYVWSETFDEVLGQAADRFGAQVIDGDLYAELEHEIDLFVYTDYSWRSARQFAQTIKETKKLLSVAGKACFAVSARGDGSLRQVNWQDGSGTSLSKIMQEGFPHVAPPEQLRKVCLSQLEPNSILPAFLKRNRDFFGRNMREEFLERMQEMDFRGSVGAPAQALIWACLLVWNREG
jgi:hypothetical protein